VGYQISDIRCASRISNPASLFSTAMSKRTCAILSGPLLFLLMWMWNPFALEPAAAKTSGVVLWMLVWWVSEAVPMAITSILPIILFPILGILSIEKACTPYGNKFVFLFLGGFIIALAMEKWNLHRRLSLNIVNFTGSSADRIIFGFFLASYLLSMWISNTATALMMFPIASSVVALLVSPHPSPLGERSEVRSGIRNFSLCIMLSIAYGANIGGIATLVGTPPNAAMAGLLSDKFATEVSFFDWMKIALPFSFVLLILSYLLLVKVIFPNRLGRFELGHEIVQQELRLLGKWTAQEKRVFVVFVSTAMLWIFQEPFNNLLHADFIQHYVKNESIEFTDVGIAITAGLLLFLVPSKSFKSKPLLEWKDSERLPWGILLMFGGGMALATAFDISGLDDAVANQMNTLDKSNLVLFGIILCGVGLLLTALMSNLAMVNIFVPIVVVLAISAGKSPELFAIPVTIAASCDFMFPMSTPPNAIAYSSGYVRATDMLRAGVVLNLLSWVLLAVMVYITF